MSLSQESAVKHPLWTCHLLMAMAASVVEYLEWLKQKSSKESIFLSEAYIRVTFLHPKHQYADR